MPKHFEGITNENHGIAINPNHIVSYSIENKELIVRTSDGLAHNIIEVGEYPDRCRNQIVNYFKKHIETKR